MKQQLLRWIIEFMERNAPEPSHKGPCGPEAGCDAGCMDAAYFAENMEEIRKYVITAKEGLLWQNGKPITDVFSADAIARDNGFQYAEQMVKYIQETEP